MLRVLVVEDDQDNADSLALLLRLGGHDVEVTADGLSALQAVQSAQPDVVLLDIGLPKLDGWHVAKEIRQHRNGKRRPLIIAVTGYGDQPSRLRSYESGIDLHLTKPVNPVELEDLLKRYRAIMEDPKWSPA
jgi:two-component system OmpR family response regulator